MTDGPTTTLEVVHRTRERLRIAVQPASRDELAALCDGLHELTGVTQAAVGASGRNLVVRFDPRRMREETLLMRLALAVSARRQYDPVRVIRDRRSEGLDLPAVGAGTAAGAATLLRFVAPASGLATVGGWVAAGLTLGSVSHSVARGLSEGTPRPEGLSLLHLVSRLGKPDRGLGALLTWLLYHGPEVAESARGQKADGFELRPVARSSGAGVDEDGTHMELMTRPVRMRGALEGSLLTPATLVSAAVGYLAYAIGEGWLGGE